MMKLLQAVVLSTYALDQVLNHPQHHTRYEQIILQEGLYIYGNHASHIVPLPYCPLPHTREY